MYRIEAPIQQATDQALAASAEVASFEAPKIYHAFQNQRMNFTAFSRGFSYRSENAELMFKAMSYLPDRFTGVDIGSGNGLGAQLVKGMTDIFLRRVIMWNIDPDPYALRQAWKDTPNSRRFKAYWIEGFGQDVESLLKGQMPEEGVDMVSMLDDVHEFPPDDQFPIIRAGARILKPGGIMVMNSQFTDIATAENRAEWSLPAARAAMKFGKITKAEQPGLLQRAPAEYTQMGEDAGLEQVYYMVADVLYPTQALVDINRYPGYVEGVRRSFVFEKGQPSLEELSRELQLTYGRSKPLSRKSARWIFIKPE